jgi:ABC-type transport system involved in cytochrome c biogenesis permease component
MSDEHARSRFGELIVSILFVSILIPILLLTASYLEFRIAGTKRLKEALHIGQLLHELEAVNLRR